MAQEELDLVNELNVYTGLDSFNSNTVEKELALCGKLGANVQSLKAMGFNALQLVEIRKGLEDEKVDARKYLNPKLSWTDMEEMRLEMSQGIDMSQYRAQGFDTQQLYQIREGIASGVDVSAYAKKEYLADQMRQLRLGLSKKDGVPIIFFQDPAFDAMQMHEIRKGLEAGIDISTYAFLEMPYMKMRAIRKSAEDGLIFDEADIKKYNANILKQIHEAYKDKVDISRYVKNRYDAEQLEEIRICLKKGLKIDNYINSDMRGDAIREIRVGLEEGIDVGKYADASYGWQQMIEIRTGLEHQIDVRPYCKSLYQADQMREIRLGIEAGLDIAQYTSMMYTAKDMRRIRKKLISGELHKVLSDDGIEGTVLDRTEGISDGAALLESLIERKAEVLELTSNKMLCWLKLPKRNDLSSITEDMVLMLLFKSNIRKGINREEIKKMVKFPVGGEKYLVASGKEPVNGQDGYYEYFIDIEKDNEPEFLKDGSADFSNLDIVNQIHVGDKIAVYHRATKGEDGFNVLGEVSTAQNGKEKAILKGDGFMILSDRVTYVAKISGALTVVNGDINIKKVMIVPEVKITDKKITYDGVVFVKGDVNSGSEISATGDVIIGGHMESSTIESGGNVIIGGGATCPVRGTIVAEGNVTAKFFEGVVIKGKNVSANYFINCTIESNGFIKTYGRQGLIYGGTAYSLVGIESAVIGNKTGAKTVITLGVNTTLLAEHNQIQKQISREEEELKVLEKEKNRLMEIGSGNRELMQWKIKINAAVGSKEAAIKKLEAHRAELEKDMNLGNAPKATVTEMAFAGTIFVIEGVAYKLTEDRKVYDKLVFRTDAKKEKMIII